MSRRALVLAVALAVMSSGCMSGDEKGEETVYEIVDPPSTSPVAPSTTRPVPDPVTEPSLPPVVTQAESLDSGLVTLLTVAPRRGSVKALPFVSRVSERARATAEVCTPSGTCAPPGTLFLTFDCAGAGMVVVSIDGTRELDAYCDDMSSSSVRIDWPQAGADTATVSATAASAIRWSMRIEQMVAPT